MMKAPIAKAYRNASKALEHCRLAIQTLIDQTSIDDLYAFEQLGPILAEVRTAQAIVEQLTPQQNNA